MFLISFDHFAILPNLNHIFKNKKDITENFHKLSFYPWFLPNTKITKADSLLFCYSQYYLNEHLW